MSLKKMLKKYNFKSFVAFVNAIIFMIILLCSEQFYRGGWILFVLIVYIIIHRFISFVIAKKRLQKLIIKYGDTYENELNNIILQTKENCIFTENYAFLFDEDIEICTYDDLVMLYRQTKLVDGEGVVTYLHLITKKYKHRIILFHSWENRANGDIKLEELLLAKNPNILIGRTAENRKILKEKYNIKI